jgi:chromate transporter, chromate ion transporter (CHR) family
VPDKAKPTAASNPTTPGVYEAPCSLREFWLYFIRLGTLGFGGPIALAGHMQRDLVEQRGWISRQNYMDGLAFSQLSPGPLAAQLAMYLGWIRGGFLGATLTGIAFILPSFLMVLLLAALYIHYGQLSWLQGMFYGIGAAVIAIIARSAHKLVRTTIGADPLLWVLFAVVAITTAWTESEIVWLFILSGIISLLVKAPPGMQANSTAVLRSMGIEWLFAGVHGTAAAGTLLALFLYFLKAGAFVFGSGLAIVPFLHSGAVTEHHWITEQQFLDAVAVAMITPGPVVITAAFIGYLVAGLAGATLAAVAVFAPPISL